MLVRRGIARACRLVAARPLQRHVARVPILSVRARVRARVCVCVWGAGGVGAWCMGGRTRAEKSALKRRHSCPAWARTA